MDHTDFNCRLVRSKRKTLAIEVTPDGDVVVRAPLYATGEAITAFVRENSEWTARKIEEQQQKQAERKRQEAEDPVKPLSREELEELGKAAAGYIPMRVAHYAALMGVDFGRVTIRNQTTRWGSCSAKHNLNFNVLLMLMPREVIDSVIVHELCHIRHMNHSKAFYAEVHKYFPEYPRWDKWLKRNGDRIMRRMPV